MSYYYKVLRDHPIGFWTLDDSSIEALDLSGSGNNGTYTGQFPSQTKNIPIVSGGDYSAKITSSSYIDLTITNDYYGQESNGGFGTVHTSDNDFTIECWILPKISSENLTTIVADSTNDVGIFWQNNNILFFMGTELLEYTIPETNKSIYIVCKYSVNSASIYLNGELVVSKTIQSNPFENVDMLLKSGPTQDIEDEFLIDNIAVYRYALSDKKIKEHYLSNENTLSIQVAYPDNGEIFNIYDNGMRTSFVYNYPKDKSWEYFLTNDLSLNKSDNYIEISKTESADAKEIIIEDIVSMPTGIAMDSSKIEWDGSTGISVYTSLDGVSYEQCTNGYPIPQYTYSEFNEQKFIYIKIIMESSDSSRYMPKLYSLSINFYSQQILYSKNGGSYISKIEDKDYMLGKEVYPVLSVNTRNGAYVPENSGFKINASYDINSIEFFYIPESLQGSLLVSASNTLFKWASNGTVTKNNISKIYVNGQDKSTETNISNILGPGYLNHIVIVLNNTETGEIVFNYQSAGSVPACYQHISLYKHEMEYNEILNHYNLYIGKSRYTATGSTMSMTENSTRLYNNDWVVIQNS